MALDLIQQLIQEAQSYQDGHTIERLAQSGQLPNVPLQPLAMTFRQMNAQKIAQYLPLLSPDQRSALLDLDLWHRDEINPQEFSFWIDAYHRTPNEELKIELLQSEPFVLYLKGSTTISTFDEEDPWYPDHEHFFLTDDHLLLIEYNKSFPYPEELQSLLRFFYSHLGVEAAYAHLFKIVSDSFPMHLEEQYHFKKSRLRDYGFTDYYDALELLAPLAPNQLRFLTQKKPQKATGKINSELKNQVLSHPTLVPYQKEFEPIHHEVAKVQDQKRRDFLQFNFIKLVNATLSHDDTFKKTGLAMAQTGVKTRYWLLLGLDYLKSTRSFEPTGVFHLFDFFEVYRVGKSLIYHRSQQLKKAMAKHHLNFSAGEAFLGSFFQAVLEKSLGNPAQIVDRKSLNTHPISDAKTWDRWQQQTQCLLDLLPFISQFHKSYSSMQEFLNDEDFLNYQVSDIDFEALILSSLMHFELGHYQDEDHSPKMGLFPEDLRAFVAKYFNPKGHLISSQALRESIQSFLISFGLHQIGQMDEYLHGLLLHHLAGYELASMSEEDFRHIGGPILLKDKDAP